jgi:hypothetical protein
MYAQARKGIRGYFGQSAGEPASDMTELKSFLIGMKTFDPSLDTTALVHTFVRDFFGAPIACVVPPLLTL